MPFQTIPHPLRYTPCLQLSLSELQTTACSESRSAPIELLDVGSCGSLFNGVPGLVPTALDLCPSEGSDTVYKSDFLSLEVILTTLTTYYFLH